MTARRICGWLGAAGIAVLTATALVVPTVARADSGPLDALSDSPDGASALVRYAHPIRSSTLAERLRDEHSVLVVPGDFFDMDGYLRIGFGSDPQHLSSALTLIGECLAAISVHAR